MPPLKLPHKMNIQQINVEYDEIIMRCQLCHCVEESNGTMISMCKCNHTYHISCLIKYCVKNEIKCPECDQKFYDSRLAIALAFT